MRVSLVGKILILSQGLIRSANKRLPDGRKVKMLMRLPKKEGDITNIRRRNDSLSLIRCTSFMLVAARCLTTRTKLQLHPWTGNRWAQFNLAALYKMGWVRDIVCIYHYIIIIIILPVQYILRTCNCLAASPQP